VAEGVRRGDADTSASVCESEWARVLGHLKAEVGEAAYRSWLRPMSVERVDDGEAIVAAPTRFLRDWVATHYADRLLALWRAENQRVINLSIVVAGAPRRNGLDRSAAASGESKDRGGPTPRRDESPRLAPTRFIRCRSTRSFFTAGSASAKPI